MWLSLSMCTSTPAAASPKMLSFVYAHNYHSDQFRQPRWSGGLTLVTSFAASTTHAREKHPLHVEHFCWDVVYVTPFDALSDMTPLGRDGGSLWIDLKFKEFAKSRDYFLPSSSSSICAVRWQEAPPVSAPRPPSLPPSSP